jgi:hypothetical protein
MILNNVAAQLYVAGQVFQFWIDPAPGKDPTRIVIERSDARRVSAEVIVRRSIILDHIPTNFDVAFTRAREALMLDHLGATTTDGTLRASTDEQQGGTQLDDNVQRASEEPNKSILDGLWSTLAKVGLAGTTQVDGGEGHAMNPSQQHKGQLHQ